MQCELLLKLPDVEPQRHVLGVLGRRANVRVQRLVVAPFTLEVDRLLVGAQERTGHHELAPGRPRGPALSRAGKYGRRRVVGTLLDGVFPPRGPNGLGRIALIRKLDDLHRQAIPRSPFAPHQNALHLPRVLWLCRAQKVQRGSEHVARVDAAPAEHLQEVALRDGARHRLGRLESHACEALAEQQREPLGVRITQVRPRGERVHLDPAWAIREPGKREMAEGPRENHERDDHQGNHRPGLRRGNQYGFPHLVVRRRRSVPNEIGQGEEEPEAQGEDDRPSEQSRPASRVACRSTLRLASSDHHLAPSGRCSTPLYARRSVK